MDEEKEQYRKALDLTFTLVRERLSDELVALYLGGSYLRGDYIPGWSDIDIATTVKDEVWTDESSKKQFFEKCKRIRKEVEDAYPIVVIDLGNPLGTTSESIARNSTNLASFFNRKEKLVFGRDILKEAAPINPEKLSELGRAATLSICGITLDILGSKGILDRTRSVDSARAAITYIMKIAQNSLIMKGIVGLLKKDIVDTFEREYPGFRPKSVVRKAYELQFAWKKISEGKVNPKKLRAFIEEAKVFANNMISEISAHE